MRKEDKNICGKIICLLFIMVAGALLLIGMETNNQIISIIIILLTCIVCIILVYFVIIKLIKQYKVEFNKQKTERRQIKDEL